MNSGIDNNGKITFWDYNVYYAGDRGAETMYNVPHQKRTVYGRGWRAPGIHPFPTGAWRGPGNSTNTFAREVQVDIIRITSYNVCYTKLLRHQISDGVN